jgi:hypothetical protein
LELEWPTKMVVSPCFTNKHGVLAWFNRLTSKSGEIQQHNGLVLCGENHHMFFTPNHPILAYHPMFRW